MLIVFLLARDEIRVMMHKSLRPGINLPFMAQLKYLAPYFLLTTTFNTISDIYPFTEGMTRFELTTQKAKTFLRIAST